MQASRDDFVIAVRSAFLKKENKQKFSLLGLIFLTFLILFLEKFNLKPIDYIKISLREVAYRSTFIVSIPENFIKKTYIATKIITNAPVIFITRKTSIINVGIGNNITPRINITAIASNVLLPDPKIEANLVVFLLAMCHSLC